VLNAFQSTAFQQTSDHVAFQEFLPSGGGSDTGYDRHWRWNSDLRHRAAVSLGREGGLIGGPARAKLLR